MQDLNEKVLTHKEVNALVGMSRTTRDRLESRGHFPQRKQYAPNKVGYLQSEILSFMNDPEGWREAHATEDMSLAPITGAVADKIREKKAAAAA